MPKVIHIVITMRAKTILLIGYHSNQAKGYVPAQNFSQRQQPNFQYNANHNQQVNRQYNVNHTKQTNRQYDINHNQQTNRQYDTNHNQQTSRQYDANHGQQANFQSDVNRKQQGNYQAKTNKNYNNVSQNNNQNYSQEESLLMQDVYGKKDDFANNTSPDFSALFQTFFGSQNSSQSTNQNSNSNSKDNSNSTSNFEMLDMETILKFKKIFDRLQTSSNSNEPIVNLLRAIKPFMQESKKSIVDQIVKFITISAVLKDFNGIF